MSASAAAGTPRGEGRVARVAGRGSRASMIAPSGEQVELRLGDQRAVVVEVGGGLREYERGGRALLDEYALDEMCTSGRGQVLIPWPNRLQHGSYEFDGTRHQLALTEPENGNAIHGLVRWAAWRVGEQKPHRVVMEHVLHPKPGYPFSLALSVEYLLSPDGLAVRTTATNVGASACPYGSGAHPYLTLGTPVVDPVVLRVPARTVLHVHRVLHTAFEQARKWKLIGENPARDAKAPSPEKSAARAFSKDEVARQHRTRQRRSRSRAVGRVSRRSPRPS